MRKPNSETTTKTVSLRFSKAFSTALTTCKVLGGVSSESLSKITLECGNFLLNANSPKSLSLVRRIRLSDKASEITSSSSIPGDISGTHKTSWPCLRKVSTTVLPMFSLARIFKADLRRPARGRWFLLQALFQHKAMRPGCPWVLIGGAL